MLFATLATLPFAAAAVAPIALPPAGAKPDYQLGGAYNPPSGVGVVVRDREADAASGIYSICYINGFQGQPDDDTWTGGNADLLLRKNGKVVMDPDWDEPILDTSNADKRNRLANIVKGWIDGCANKGYRGIELDNFDTFTRFSQLSQENNVEYAKLLINHAHSRGLAVAQKNAAEITSVGKSAGFDFAIAESCAVYDECDAYTDVYGKHVIEIEYKGESEKAWNRACSTNNGISKVRRDLDLVASGKGGYYAAWC